jgi:poly(3-hydroxybutyrate) depolymerase
MERADAAPTAVDAAMVTEEDAARATRDAETRDAETRDAETRDAGTRDAESSDAQVDVPACSVSATAARCRSASVESVGRGGDLRRVYWNQPSTPAPPAGHPAVILYQGSLHGPATSWDLDLAPSAAFGGYYQVVLVARLIEAGFVVIQPEAQGGLYWTTNQGGDYGSSADGTFIPRLLEAITQQRFGPIDLDRLYATGISSGGYMTSRMAVSYPGRFRALAIQSGSYASCLGPLCSVPDQLPGDPAPTVRRPGARDGTVPISTARSYEAKLKANAIEVEFIADPSAGHAWLATAPDAITRWFSTH